MCFTGLIDGLVAVGGFNDACLFLFLFYCLLCYAGCFGCLLVFLDVVNCLL